MTFDSEAFLARVVEQNQGEPEFHQAVHEVVESLTPLAQKHPAEVDPVVVQQMVEPERVHMFRVAWQDDAGDTQLNKGYRVQFSTALGPVKGGLRFHPSVTLGTVKFLGFEQMFKNALTGLMLGAGKGGSNFNPRGRSDAEVMRFCQAFMTGLYTSIGADTDVPAGDIGVGGREIGYLFGQYRRLTRRFEAGVLTGKDPVWGGSHGRTEATGFGLVFFTQAMLAAAGTDFSGKQVVVSGSGNVSIFAMQKATELGATVVACSDSGSAVYDPEGIDFDLVKDIKLVRRGRLTEYAEHRPKAQIRDSADIWAVPCQVALPCATQNELPESAAKQLIANGVQAVAEGANMPCTPEAVDMFRQAKVSFGPGKAANAGGVATSGLEMQQNAARTQWTFGQTIGQLQSIMQHIHSTCTETAEEMDAAGDYVVGANIAGFRRVSAAMTQQGIL